jgi:hypothetical protein
MLTFSGTAALFSRQPKVEKSSKAALPSESRPSFHLLPLEIRWKIYSHLLFDENVAETTEDKKLRLRFATALFTASRQISSESLDFFYSENTFLLLETNIKELFSAAQDAIPMIRHDNTAGYRLPHLASAIRFNRTSYRFDVSYAIFASRNLPTLVQLLNTEHLQRSIAEIDLTLNFARSAGNPRTSREMDRIVDDLGWIRKLPDIQHRTLTFKIEGSLSKKRRAALEANFSKPALTPQDFVSMALQARERGQACLAVGDYTAARGEFTFCSHLTKLLLERIKHPWPWERFHCNRRSTVECLVVDLHLDMSLIESAQGYHEDAIWHAEKAWEMAFVGADPFGQVADLKFSLGVALAAGERYEDAVGALSHACAFDPENEVMRAMLECLKALLEEQKRGYEGQMLVDGERSLNRWFEVAMVERRSQKVSLDDRE